MRIAVANPLHFALPYLGGGERYTLTMARAVMEAAGDAADVELVSVGTSGRRELGGVPLRLLDPAPLAPTGGGDFDRVSWELADAFSGCDVVHLHHPFTRFGQSAAVLAKAAGAALVLTDHAAFSIEPHDRELVRGLADEVVAYSSFGATRPRVRASIVIPGGVDSKVFHPDDHVHARRGFVFVGRVLPHKGVDRAVRMLPTRATLDICGTFGHVAYRRHLEQLAVGKRVRFVAEPSDAALRRRVARARALVLPTVTIDCFGSVQVEPELMGLAALEAMACGTPPIVSDKGALPEFVEDGVTGFVVRDDVELGSALDALEHDEGLSDRLGRAARARVEAEFSDVVAGRALLEVYRSLAARRRVA